MAEPETSFEYVNHNPVYGESLIITNSYNTKIRISRNITLNSGEEMGPVGYIEITDHLGGYPTKYDFVLTSEQVDELITHLYNVRNGTNFGGNNEPDS